MHSKTARVEFGRISITTNGREKELPSGTPVQVDASKYLYIGHDGNWRYSLKKHVETIEFTQDGDLIITTNKNNTRIHCQDALDDWESFQTTLLKHWNKITESREPSAAAAVRSKAKRQRRAYGKNGHSSRKGMSYMSASTWNFSEDEEDENRPPTTSSYFSKKPTKASMKRHAFQNKENHQEEEEDENGATNEENDVVEMMEVDDEEKTIEEVQDEQLDSDDDLVLNRKRKLPSSRHAALDSDSDQDEAVFTTPLSDDTHIVSPPPQATDVPDKSDQKKKDQQEEPFNKRITNFFAPQMKKCTAAKGVASAAKSVTASASPKTSPVRPRLSPFVKEDTGSITKSASKPRESLTQDTNWLEQPRSPSISTPTRSPNKAISPLDDDDIVSTPPHTPSKKATPPRTTVMPRSVSRKASTMTPARKRFRIGPRHYGSKADEALDGTTPSRSLRLSSSTPSTSLKKKLSPSLTKSKLPPPTPYKGLFNLGNTCYLNASVQALYSIPGFVDGLSEAVKGVQDSQEKLPLSYSLSQVFQQLTSNETTVDPATLKAAMDEWTDKFEGRQQRDAHEFLSELVDGLHEELSKQASLKQFVDSYFRMSVKVCLECDECGYSRSKDEMYRHLSIDVDPTDEGWSIAKGLQKFFEPEKREVNCEKCSAGKTATQTLVVQSSPKALLLHLKRFVLVEKPRIRDVQDEEKENRPPVEMTFRKNKARVEIPENLSLSSFMEKEDKGDSGGEAPSFHLKSVVHHIGSTAFSGHYTAEALRSKDEWITFDDSSTSFATKSKRNEQTAYMVLYGM